MPTLSVIMPVYNRMEFLTDSIESVQIQSFTDWELLIVDDGSDDGSHEHAREFAGADPRIHVLSRIDPPKGAATCRNIGMERAKGEYILFLDSDDLLPPSCLEERVAAMQKEPDLDAIVFGCRTFETDPGRSLEYEGCAEYADPVLNFLTCPVPWFITSPLWRAHSLQNLHGHFKESLSAFQDWEFHLRLLLAGAEIKDLRPAAPFLCRRDNPNSISSQNRTTAYLRSFLNATLSISRKLQASGRNGRAVSLVRRRTRFALLRLLRHGHARWTLQKLRDPDHGTCLSNLERTVFILISLLLFPVTRAQAPEGVST